MVRKLDRAFLYTMVVYIWVSMLYADRDLNLERILFRLGVVGLITYLALRKAFTIK